ncbi:hypothetical protein [Sessilibacter corallicola]|uniref:hypothetical protein n=1 Tax=Sessilibacter corallicola TaxID=2904075 RepID=UPI001E532586|nr:hypothetical protein [Sessilibacter corallicola]MCE2028694.1 hypothetical protein [Sessilibacter corallicola]
MEYTYRYENEQNTIKVSELGNERYQFMVFSKKSKLFHKKMEINLSKTDLEEIRYLMKDIGEVKAKVGKSSGVYRQYLSIERENKNSTATIVINKWFIIFGGTLRIRLSDVGRQVLRVFLN